MNNWMCDISLWQFPASAILGAAFLLAIWSLHHYGRHTRPHRILSNGTASVVLLLIAALAIAVEGTWAFGLYHWWPFIGLMLLLMSNLGFVVLRRLPSHDWGFLTNHAGLLLILWASFFGASDVTHARMVLHTNQTSHTAYSTQGHVVPLPFEVQLERFTIEYYDDGLTPRQYRSELTIDHTPCVTEVNGPIHTHGYTIFQESYDRTHGAYTVLLLVRDPWLPLVWAGTALLAIGSLILILRKR